MQCYQEVKATWRKENMYMFVSWLVKKKWVIAILAEQTSLKYSSEKKFKYPHMKNILLENTQQGMAFLQQEILKLSSISNSQM